MTVGGGVAADQMVRMMLSGGEVAVRLGGSALKNLLALTMVLARQKVDIYFNFIGCFVPPKPEDILTAEEEAKAQKALAARNREREQNKLRMRRVREAQRAVKEAEKFSSPGG